MLDEADQARIDEAEQARIDEALQTPLIQPRALSTLSPFTVICLSLNQTIGAGIFMTPVYVLKSTGSSGISLLLWVAGAISAMSGLLVWLELGLSTPKFEVPNSEGARMQCVPRSGGEKNFFEYIYGHSNMRTVSIYGMLFITLGHLSGNAVQFGTYILQAACEQPSRIQHQEDISRGLGIICITFACLIHFISRWAGIRVMNALSVMKVLLLIVIIILGFAYGAGAKFGLKSIHRTTAKSNFDYHSSFAHPERDLASIASSLLLILQTFSGFQQPFYVLSEVYRPKKYFAPSTIAAMGMVIVLFVLVNIAYLCVIPISEVLKADLNQDMGTAFFREIFGSLVSDRVVSGFLALSLFGTVATTTFTAAQGGSSFFQTASDVKDEASIDRMKFSVIYFTGLIIANLLTQEIAREGVLPLLFGRSTDTLSSILKFKFHSSEVEDGWLETTPTGGLALHWIFSVLLVACSSSLDPVAGSNLLSSLYHYGLIFLVGFFASAGLLFLQARSSRFSRILPGEKGDWLSTAGFRPWGGSAAAIIYTSVTGFAIAAAWIPPKAQSPFARSSTGFEWYIVPTVCFGVLLLGYAYYLLIMYILPPIFTPGRRRTWKREVMIVSDQHGEYVQKYELVELTWKNTTWFRR